MPPLPLFVGRYHPVLHQQLAHVRRMSTVCTPTDVRNVHFWQRSNREKGGLSYPSEKGINLLKVTEREDYPLYSPRGERV